MFDISKNLCIFRTVLKSKMEKYTKRDPHTRLCCETVYTKKYYLN